jgi:hypothetical protein
MAYKMTAERDTETVKSSRISLIVAVAKARVWASEGWQVTITTDDGKVFAPAEFDDLLAAWATMPIVKLRASTILGAYEQAETELVGKAVVLTDGKAGTVEKLWLDEFHGLRISIRGHDGKWPISTIKFTQV